jgi:hypothetical protein
MSKQAIATAAVFALLTIFMAYKSVTSFLEGDMLDATVYGGLGIANTFITIGKIKKLLPVTNS